MEQEKERKGPKGRKGQKGYFTISAGVAILGLIAILGSSAIAAEKEAALDWPKITCEARPWAYWWWHGSAVDPQSLAHEMQRYHDGGLGGMHIIPIYGTKGCEAKEIEYLSPKWMEMMGVAATEARKRGMDVDMTLGTGWCFGGPETTPDEANAQVIVNTSKVEAGSALTEKFDKSATQALVAFAPDGKCVELTGKIGADGTVAQASSLLTGNSPWTVYAISQKPSRQMVKRAALGGAGPMLNPFYGKAINHYLERFTKAFDAWQGPKPRAVYHDSYEYQCGWSPDLFKEFEKRRGYRLQTQLPALFGKEETETAGRIKCDMRETISDLMVENFNTAWIGWAHARGIKTRDQAHGSPGNLLDLYAGADIPETEMFNTDRDVLVSKVASSAAHVAGHQLVASETGTWLAEHFTETLGAVKDLLDELFVAGVNHVVYHGCCYSPDEAAWPGWLFYASTEMNPRNSIWRDAPALNQYIARCQSILQAGRPDNDILLYWPIYDMWSEPAGMVQNMSVHRSSWIRGRPFGDVADRLWKQGYTFDYVSDRMLKDAKVTDGKIEMPGGVYKTILVPQCKTMPLNTLRRLRELAESGAMIQFVNELPEDVPGLGMLEERRAHLKAMKMQLNADGQARIGNIPVGRERFLMGDLEKNLLNAGIEREPLVDHEGVMFIRRAWDGGRHYFIANRGTKAMDRYITLAGHPAGVAIMDPLTGQAGMATTSKNMVYLQLPPGSSVILRTFKQDAPKGPVWTYTQTSGETVELKGTWRVEFVEGGPALPKPFETAALASWTAQPDPEAQRFAGAARYTLTFDAPKAGGPWRLDLGKVCQSARVKVNGKDLGTLFAPPFRVSAAWLKEKGNVLEIEVTNVSANRIRDLDRRKVEWKIFYDINFASMTYKGFDASDWPLADSGLLGPVTLTPEEAFAPERL